MSTSTKQPPLRVFENYVFTRAVSPNAGLMKVTTETFGPCSPGQASEGADPGVGYTSGSGVSVPLPIGFDFQIDGITYNHFCAATNGWMALVDPVQGTFASTEVLEGLIGTSFRNDTIKTTFDTNAVLLAPWFAPSMRNVASDAQQLLNNGDIGQDKMDRIQRGFEPPPIQLNAREFAVKYTNINTPTGRALVVRWNTLICNLPMKPITPGPGCRARFEAVIYENGTIEYRYEEKRNLPLQLSAGGQLESATIGIFMPGGVINEDGLFGRWRDFSIGLGYKDQGRIPYRYGGYIYDNNRSYIDVADNTTDSGTQKTYTVNLKSSLHWPASRGMGAIFTFAPPTARRKVLPKSSVKDLGSNPSWPQVARIAVDRMGGRRSFYDDRKMIVYTSGVVNFPTMLPRFYGDGEPGVIARQDIFAGDFEITGSTIRSLSEQFVGKEFKEYIKPFNENKKFESTPSAAGDVFYTTGSSVDLFGTALSQPLKAKTQVKIGLSVNNKVKMPGLSSSIYYYNSIAGAWETPLNSSYIISDLSSSVPVGNINGDMCNPIIYTGFDYSGDGFNDGAIIEDGRGFGPIGNTLASGSNPLQGRATDPFIINTFYNKTTSSVADILDRTYAKSVQLNPKYEATSQETFTLPISQPFLIEKAVIEVPLAMGDKWFKNLTTSFLPIIYPTGSNDPPDVISGSFDFAGPALTVALFNQIKVGNTTRRDLILTGTITHAIDNHAIIKLTRDPPYSDSFQARPVGFRSYANPGAVITPESSSTGYSFTGSVAVPCEAAVTNGIMLKWTKGPTGAVVVFSSQYRQGLRDLFASPEIDISNTPNEGGFTEQATIAYVDPFGRSSTGFNASGRSVFGQEFTLLTKGRGRIRNPLYITGSVATKTGADSGLPAEIEATIGTGASQFSAAAVAAAQLGSTRRSPYLVKPGDQLILSISKTRPFFYGSTIAPTVSGSLNDDVTLNTGSINLTFYGCTLGAQQEINDTLNQSLVSDIIHETIGAEPVLDQFEVAFRDEYVGGMFDDYITGSMINRVVSRDGSIKLEQSLSPRGRVFSVYNAQNQPMLQYSGSAFLPDRITGNQENITNPSKNFRLQPWFERTGTQRVLKMTSPGERLWDSLLPSFVECMNADGTGIAITSPDVAPQGAEHSLSGTYGFIHFDTAFGTKPYMNYRWSRSFPFEPHYAQATRLFDISTSFVATYYEDFSTGQMSQVSGVPLTGFFIGIDRRGGPANPSAVSEMYYADANLSGKLVTTYQFFSPVEFFPTSSLGLEDQLRVLYGFGDRRSIVLEGLPVVGPDHFAEIRDIGEFAPNNTIFGTSCRFCFGVAIRGWKYGILNGLPTFNGGYWRQGRYGQYRDMLEQRPYTKFYHVPDPSVSGLSSISGQTTSVVTVKFINPTNNTITQAERTWSQNLSFEATSSLPYFDGDTRNRGPIDTNTLNNSIVFITQGGDGQITL